MLSTRPLVKFSVEHPWLIIFLALVITLIFAIPLGNLNVVADIDALLQKDIDDLANEPGLDAMFIMAKGKNLYTIESLQLLEKTCRTLEETIPIAETVSPFSFVTLGNLNRLSPMPLAPEGRAPRTQEELDIFIQRLNASRFGPGIITSEDRDTLVFFFLVEKGRSYMAMMDEVEDILEPLRESLDVSATGTTALSAETERFLMEGFTELLSLVILTILISYYLGFHSTKAIFLPFTIVISGTIFSLGIMSLAHFDMTMISIISPPLILTMGSSYSIHVMNSYFNSSRDKKLSKNDLIIESVGNISGTVLLASLTTLIGLMSLSFATISQTREFAIITSLGIFFTSFLSVTLLPAFFSLQKIPEQKKLDVIKNDPLSKILKKLAPTLAKTRKNSIFVIVIITALFAYLVPRVEFNTSVSKYYPESSPLIQHLKLFMEEIGGYDEMTITLKGEGRGFFLESNVLENVHEVEEIIKMMPNISYIFSFPQYLDFAGEVMTGKEGSFKVRGINLFVSRIFNATDLSKGMVNEDFSEISIKLRFYDNHRAMPIDEKNAQKLFDEISILLETTLSEEIEWEVTGEFLDFLELSNQMKRDFYTSTITALVLIALLTTIAFKSPIRGLLSLVPLLMGIFTSLISMVIFDIPLDMTTIMVSCIAIGVGIDNSIHFLLQHRKMQERYPKDNLKAVSETIYISGRPIIITTFSIVAGLIFLSFADFQPIRYFGLLISFTLLTACFSTIALLPSLAALVKRKDNKE